MNESQIITSDQVSFYFIIPRKKRVLLAKEATFVLYPNRYEIKTDEKTTVILFDDIISAGIFGKNKMDFFTKENIYQIKADVRFNALKYVQFFYKYKNEKENKNNEFLILTMIKDIHNNNIIIPIEAETTTSVNNMMIDINRIKTIYGYNRTQPNLNKYIKDNLSSKKIEKIYEQKIIYKFRETLVKQNVKFIKKENSSTNIASQLRSL